MAAACTQAWGRVRTPPVDGCKQKRTTALGRARARRSAAPPPPPRARPAARRRDGAAWGLAATEGGAAGWRVDRAEPLSCAPSHAMSPRQCGAAARPPAAAPPALPEGAPASGLLGGQAEPPLEVPRCGKRLVVVRTLQRDGCRSARRPCPTCCCCCCRRHLPHRGASVTKCQQLRRVRSRGPADAAVLVARMTLRQQGGSTGCCAYVSPDRAPQAFAHTSPLNGRQRRERRR